MFRRNTVLVIGAGAGVPYGFSTGRGLLGKGRQLDAEAVRALTEGTVSYAAAQRLLASMVASYEPSIDAMLEHRMDLVLDGTRLMAALLLEEELAASSTFHDPEIDWMSLVFHEMSRGAAGVEAVAANPVSFITFNYDRYIEHRLAHGLSSRYNVDLLTCYRAMEQLPIVHLYGSMGPLVDPRTFGSRRAERFHAIPLGAPVERDVNNVGLAMANAENSIVVVHDARAGSQEFDRAHRLFTDAEVVFFLGFGFGEVNVARLELNRIRDDAAIRCSTFGMRDAEVAVYVNACFGGRPPGSVHFNANQLAIFLRDEIGLFR